jgi:hypothetical protein
LNLMPALRQDAPQGMKKLALAAIITTAVVAITATAEAGSSAQPVLSGRAKLPDGVQGGLPYSKGFGRYKPREVFLGGDPTGLLCHITWSSWGHQFAVGKGTAFYVGPHQSTSEGHQAPAVVVAYHLGTWKGRPAYTKIRWYFPQGGSTFGGVSHCSA